MYDIEHSDFYSRMKARQERERAEREQKNFASIREWAEYLQAHKAWNQDELARIIDGETTYAVRISGLTYCREAMAMLDRTGERKNVVDISFKNNGNYCLYIWIQK